MVSLTGAAQRPSALVQHVADEPHAAGRKCQSCRRSPARKQHLGLPGGAAGAIDMFANTHQQGGRWMPIFAGPKAHSGQTAGEKELWPMLFEKAWAKLHLSYEATAGGLTEDATSYLTGGIIKKVSLEIGVDNSAAWRECLQVLCWCSVTIHPHHSARFRHNTSK